MTLQNVYGKVIILFSQFSEQPIIKYIGTENWKIEYNLNLSAEVHILLASSQSVKWLH